MAAHNDPPRPPGGPAGDDPLARRFRALYDQHVGEILAFAVARARDFHTAQDITSEVFARLWMQLAMDKPIDHPRALLFKIARNLSIDEYRAGERPAWDDDAMDVPDVSRFTDPFTALADKQLGELLWEETAHVLSDGERELLMQHYRLDRSVKELAGQRSAEPGAIHTALSRARTAHSKAIVSWLLLQRAGELCPDMERTVSAAGRRLTRDVHRAIQEHLGACAVCQATEKRLSPTAELLGGFALVPITPDLHDAIWSRVVERIEAGDVGAGDGGGEVPPDGGPLGWLGPRALFGAGALVVVVLLLLAIPKAFDPVFGDPARVLFVLDASGSMGEELGGGGTRLASALGAMAKAAGGLDDDVAAGLSVIGDVGDDCKLESDVVAPTTTGAAKRIERAGKAVVATGNTPIGAALEQAAGTLKRTAGDSEGPEHIVLLTDGMENCDADPAAVVETLRRARPQLEVHTVGFHIDDAGAAALRDIATAGTGTYARTNDPAALLPALERGTRTERSPSSWWWVALLAACATVLLGELQRRYPRARRPLALTALTVSAVATIATAWLVIGARETDAATPGLELAFDFEQIDGHLISSADERRHGVLQGNAKVAGGGRSGNAVALDGSPEQGVRLGDVLDLPGDITVETWVKPTDPEAAGGALVAKWSDSGGYWLGGSGSPGGFAWAIGGTTARVDEGDASARWRHVAGTFDVDSGELVLYVNGKEVAAAHHEGRRSAHTGPLMLGTDSGNLWKGLMDEVRIWSSVRTAEQVCEDAGGEPGDAGDCRL